MVSLGCLGEGMAVESDHCDHRVEEVRERASMAGGGPHMM